ncbi:flagellar hook-length control protein FliK [Oceanimonas smirnovii]|uniref:Flagellar hook-length control protein FliK n=1 Tax=Oceanimonas smirnovii TaxID=264574 RepID=A0ABW7P2H5_9GAMM
MTTIIPAFVSTVSSANSLLQPKADGEGVNFAELLESAETGAGQQAQAGKLTADEQQDPATSEQGETTSKEADTKAKSDAENSTDKPAGTKAQQHNQSEEELKADMQQGGNSVPVAAMSAVESTKRDPVMADQAEPQQPAPVTDSAPAKDDAPANRDNAQRVDAHITPQAKQERTVAASANGESKKPAVQPNVATEVKHQQPAPVTDSVLAKDSASAKDDAPANRDNAQRGDAQITPQAKQERAVAASANGENKLAAQPNVATEVKPQQSAPVTGSAPAKDDAPVNRDNAQRVDAQVTPHVEQERAVAASANGESKPAAQPNVAVKEPVVKHDEAGINKAGVSVSTDATPAPQQVQQSSVQPVQSVQPSVQQLVTPSSSVPAPEPELDSSTNVVFRQDTVQPQQAATPNWLAQIEHGQRWAKQGNTESKVDMTVAEKSSESLAAQVTEKAAADAGTDGESHDENTSRGEKLAEALAGAVQSGTQPAEKTEVQPLQQTAAITPAARETAAPERAAQPQLERALNLHQATPEQNARQLSQQVQVMVNKELQEADIRLNPSELGGMRIQLKFEQGEVSMQIQAQHAQARDMLEQAMPRLRDMLNQQGIQLGQGQVGSFAGQQQGTAQNGNQGQGATGRENGHNSSSFEQGPNDDETGFTQYSSGKLLHEGGIDFFA